MAIYVIGYDLHPKQGETYGELIKAIKAVGTDYWHCLDSTWLVVTNKDEETIGKTLWQNMKPDDQLLVMKYEMHRAAWAGFGKECKDWLKANL